MTDGQQQAFASSLNDGLTKREYFAVMAMQGILANSTLIEHIAKSKYVDKGHEYTAQQSTKAADALIKALNEQP